eukprot:2461-Pyramimonas_sp.AAC.2
MFGHSGSAGQAFAIIRDVAGMVHIRSARPAISPTRVDRPRQASVKSGRQVAKELLARQSCAAQCRDIANVCAAACPTRVATKFSRRSGTGATSATQPGGNQPARSRYQRKLARDCFGARARTLGAATSMGGVGSCALLRPVRRSAVALGQQSDQLGKPTQRRARFPRRARQGQATMQLRRGAPNNDGTTSMTR